MARQAGFTEIADKVRELYKKILHFCKVRHSSFENKKYGSATVVNTTSVYLLYLYCHIVRTLMCISIG